MYLARDNPKKVRSLEDVALKHVTFINKESGHRDQTPFDFLLHEKRIEAAQVKGYATEVESHLQAGLAVLRGEQSAAFGIRYVAPYAQPPFYTALRGTVRFARVRKLYSQAAQSRSSLPVLIKAS